MRRAVVVLVAATLLGLVGSEPLQARPDDPLADRQWGPETIGAAAAWSTGRGAGTVIAVVDSGVDLDHPDLQGKLVAGLDLVDGGPPQDEDGHGTHVAGIAAAATGNGIGVVGVAPDARIMPVRVLDEDGSGTGADVSDGIRWAADNGATVINLSLGSDTQAVLGPGFGDAVRYAWSKGSIPVVAAGNQLVTGSGFADEPALVVSATSREDTKAYFSSTTGSARWAISAPGGAGALTSPVEDDILSTYHDPDRADDEYAYLAGTSMAAPHVAGAAAVLRGLGLSPQETVDRLLATAVDLGAEGRDTTFGEGRLDLAAAVAGLGPRPDATPPPATAGPDGPQEGDGPAPAALPPPTSSSSSSDPAGPAPAGSAAAPATSEPPSTTAAPTDDTSTSGSTSSTADVPGAPGDPVALGSDGSPPADRPGGGDLGPAALVAGALACAAGTGAVVVRRRARGGEAPLT